MTLRLAHHGPARGSPLESRCALTGALARPGHHRPSTSAGGHEPADAMELPAIEFGLILRHRQEGSPHGFMGGVCRLRPRRALHTQVFRWTTWFSRTMAVDTSWPKSRPHRQLWRAHLPPWPLPHPALGPLLRRWGHQAAGSTGVPEEWISPIHTGGSGRAANSGAAATGTEAEGDVVFGSAPQYVFTNPRIRAATFR